MVYRNLNQNDGVIFTIILFIKIYFIYIKLVFKISLTVLHIVKRNVRIIYTGKNSGEYLLVMKRASLLKREKERERDNIIPRFQNRLDLKSQLISQNPDTIKGCLNTRLFTFT